MSHPIHPGTPVWPGDPPVEVDPVADLATHGYASRRISLGEHAATHVVAARCFDPNGRSTEAYSPHELVRPAVVVDVRARCAARPADSLGLADLEAWEHAHGPFPDGALVLLWTGADSHWPEAPVGSPGPPASLSMAFAGLSAEAAIWLMEARGAAGVGTDAPGLEPGLDSTFAASWAVLRRGGIVLENLANLGALPTTAALVVIGALPIVGGTGSPAQVLAIVDG